MHEKQEMPGEAVARLVVSGLDELQGASGVPKSFIILRNRIHVFIGCRRYGRMDTARRVFHDTFLLLLGRLPGPRDEEHFPLLMAHLLRQLLTARSRTGQGKRADRHRNTSIVDIDAALRSLETSDRVSVRLVELYYFAGIDPIEIGAILLLDPAAVTRRLRAIRAWLAVRLAGGRPA